MRKFILLTLLASFFISAQADSPLTSTNFYTVYEEYDIVNSALDAKGKLTSELMLYLSDRAYPIDVKMAVVNAIGWNFNGQKNHEIYLDFVQKRLGISKDDEAFYKKIDADELLCLAYLKAMDDYFAVKEAKVISELAVKKSRRSEFSYTFNLIDALIGAQMAMDTNWCSVYQQVQQVSDNIDLHYDFPPEADKIVLDYIGMYKSECK